MRSTAGRGLPTEWLAVMDAPVGEWSAQRSAVRRVDGERNRHRPEQRLSSERDSIAPAFFRLAQRLVSSKHGLSDVFALAEGNADRDRQWLVDGQGHLRDGKANPLGNLA